MPNQLKKKIKTSLSYLRILSLPAESPAWDWSLERVKNNPLSTGWPGTEPGQQRRAECVRPRRRARAPPARLARGPGRIRTHSGHRPTLPEESRLPGHLLAGARPR